VFGFNTMIQRVFLSLGTNLGNRFENMTAMVHACSSILKPPITLTSLMETEPIGVPDTQQWYYNRIICGSYNKTMHTLLEQCQEIEKRLGRTAHSHLRARTADIDILLADASVVNETDLTIPHPEILNRRFCILGISEIAPEQIHPVAEIPFREIALHMNSIVAQQKINVIG